MIRNHVRKMKKEQENLVTQAWLVAHWGRVKTMPDLETTIDKINNPPKEKKVETPKTMLETIKGLNAKFGGNTY